MASANSRQLTQAHRIAQLKVGAQMIQAMRDSWSLLDPQHLDGSFERWLRTVAPLIKAHRATSAQIAANYLATFKQFELGPTARVAPVLAPDLPDDQIATSLLVTGPLSIKRAMSRGTLLEQATLIAEGASAAAAMRLVMDGGRDTVTATVKADPQATGWARVASGNACAFCAGLDGEVFSADDADFPAHDGCSCSAEPVYG